MECGTGKMVKVSDALALKYLTEKASQGVSNSEAAEKALAEYYRLPPPEKKYRERRKAVEIPDSDWPVKVTDQKLVDELRRRREEWGINATFQLSGALKEAAEREGVSL